MYAPALTRKNQGKRSSMIDSHVLVSANYLYYTNNPHKMQDFSM